MRPQRTDQRTRLLVLADLWILVATVSGSLLSEASGHRVPAGSHLVVARTHRCSWCSISQVLSSTPEAEADHGLRLAVDHLGVVSLQGVELVPLVQFAQRFQRLPHVD